MPENQSYEQLLIFYFSGTGNAKKAAEWIIEEAHAKGLQTSLFNIAKPISWFDIQFTEKTMIGFCYPTHGFNAPPILLGFINQFPKAKFNNSVFVLNTRAGMKMSKLFIQGLSGQALLLPAIKLRLKGYRLIGYRPLDLPSNWISLHPGLKNSVIHSIFNRCHRITLKFSKKILTGKKVYRGLYSLPVDLLISPIALAYYIYGRFILSKTFIALDKCDACGLCVKDCPVKAISLVSGKPFWSSKCESCMHCLNYCPKEAIVTPHGYTALIWWIAFGIIPASMLYLSHNYNIFGINESNELAHQFIDSLSSLIFGTLLIFIGYRILHSLLPLFWINKIISITSLNNYKFWRRYRAPDH